MPDPTLAELVWQDLQKEIEGIKARIALLEIRTERSETTSGHPTATVATAPLAANGAKQGDELYITDGNSLANKSSGNGVMAFYDPVLNGWVRTGFLPKRASLWHQESTVISGNAITTVVDASQAYAAVWAQLASADGDEFSQSFLLQPGNYTLYILGTTSSDHGILEWYIDDVFQFSNDWYTGVAARNVVMSGAIVVIGNGIHIIRGKTNGKNAASSNFVAAITHMWIKPTAD